MQMLYIRTTEQFPVHNKLLDSEDSSGLSITLSGSGRIHSGFRCSQYRRLYMEIEISYFAYKLSSYMVILLSDNLLKIHLES